MRWLGHLPGALHGVVLGPHLLVVAARPDALGAAHGVIRGVSLGAVVIPLPAMDVSTAATSSMATSIVAV